MKILSTAIFRGPTVFAAFPVIYTELDLEGLEAWPTARLGADFAGSLMAALPGLADHMPAGSAKSSFADRLAGRADDEEGLPFGLLFGHVSMEVERRVSALGRARGVRAHRRRHRLRVPPPRARGARRRATAWWGPRGRAREGELLA